MYAATVDTFTLTFEASGSLWRDALVLQDRQTKSLWSQVTGEAIMGPLKGKRLSLVPGQFSTYGEFKRLYPEGQLLKKPEKFDHGSHYSGYFASPNRLGIFGRANDFTRLDGKALVIGIRQGEKQYAVAYDRLEKDHVVLIDDTQPAVILSYDPATQTAIGYAWSSGSLPENPRFELDGSTLRLADSDVAWRLLDGKLIEGSKVNYGDIQPVSLITAYWFAWAGFFPETGLIK